jgi:hypothetical protein
MSDFIQAIIIVSILRVTMVIAGVVFAFMGYKLFVKGIYDSTSDIHAVWADKRLAITKAGPGIFFALFGVVVVAIGIWRDTGLDVNKHSYESSNDKSKTSINLQSNYITVSELLAKSKISPDKLPTNWLAIIYNIYINARHAGFSSDEISAMFNDVVKPAIDVDRESVEKEPKKLNDIRTEMFKKIQTDIPKQFEEVQNSLKDVPSEKYGKWGLGAD